MSVAASGLAHSIHTRLIRHAKSLGADPNFVLTRFATERFLYRLSRSRHAERFVLKGALLLLVRLGETFRSTRDADLLGFGDLSDDALASILSEICAIEVEPDAVTFEIPTIRLSPIRQEDIYGGRRINLLARLGSARIRLQVDVGIGDVIIPEPEWIEYPSLLDLPCPRLLAYRLETVIAEKSQTMIQLGTINSWIRDFFDLYQLAQRESFDGKTLVAALRATFDRRRTVIPDGLPTALTPAFALLPDKPSQWNGFLRKNRLKEMPKDMKTVLSALAEFLGPVFEAALGKNELSSVWPPGGPWTSTNKRKEIRRFDDAQKIL
jgi:predicted nucleotidyltransferase component of viral defense system